MSDVEPKYRISEAQHSCLLYIEQHYLLDGSIPTVERLADVCGVRVDTVRGWFKDEGFNHVLQYKGIALPNTHGALSAPQLMIISMMLNIKDKRSLRQKCEACGITLQKLAAWRKDPHFNAYLQRRAEALYKDGEAEAFVALMRSIDAGDFQATKFYFEMTGRYNPRSTDNVNLEGFLSSVIEIIQARVQDPQVLGLIANDFDKLLKGEPVVLSDTRPMAAIEATEVEPEPKPEVMRARPVEPAVFQINLDDAL